MPAPTSLDDEWEYEYSTTETETFYVDLDLSSVNGVIKSTNAGDRKSLKKPEVLAKDASKNKAATRTGADNDTGDIPNQEGPDDNDDGINEELDLGENVEANSPAQAQSPQEPGLLDGDYNGKMQMLDFDTTNPIISYNGHTYSCTWHDMLGTTMFISKHQEAPFHEPEISTEAYDLIGATRIKLVGHRAKVVPKAGSKKRRRDEQDEDEDEDVEMEAEPAGPMRGFQQYIPDGKSLGTIKRTNPKTNIEIKQQASFLEKLMEIKKARGEIDTVRTFADKAIIAADARQARKAKRLMAKERNKKPETEEQRLRREINELNQRVVKGDSKALERLQEIYADMEEAEDEEGEFLVGDGDRDRDLASRPAPVNDDTSADAVAEHVQVPASGGELDQSAEVPHAPDTHPNGASASAPLH